MSELPTSNERVSAQHLQNLREIAATVAVNGKLLIQLIDEIEERRAEHLEDVERMDRAATAMEAYQSEIKRLTTVETKAPQRYGWCVTGMYKVGHVGQFGPDEAEYVLAQKTSTEPGS